MSGALTALNYVCASEHSLHAHEHGAIKLEMAVDQKNIEIDLDGPAESFLGFEYRPKSDREKEIFNRHQLNWTQHLNSFISFDKNLKCLVKEASFKQVIDKVIDKDIDKDESSVTKRINKKEEGVHSDIEASAKIGCAKNVSGSIVTISLRKAFPKINKLVVDIISNQVQSVEIIKDVQTFKIK